LCVGVTYPSWSVGEVSPLAIRDCRDSTNDFSLIISATCNRKSYKDMTDRCSYWETGPTGAHTERQGQRVLIQRHDWQVSHWEAWLTGVILGSRTGRCSYWERWPRGAHTERQGRQVLILRNMADGCHTGRHDWQVSYWDMADMCSYWEPSLRAVGAYWQG